ncbi:hypothetical protein P8452_20074 [Trifolium repens]|nr:hypothetical protein P8452_20074 [Trifolium repens]
MFTLRHRSPEWKRQATWWEGGKCKYYGYLICLVVGLLALVGYGGCFRGGFDPANLFGGDILPGKENVRIKVRVIRMWKVPAFINPCEFNSIELVLIDQKNKRTNFKLQKVFSTCSIRSRAREPGIVTSSTEAEMLQVEVKKNYTIDKSQSEMKSKY